MPAIRRDVARADRAGDSARVCEILGDLWILLPLYATTARLRAVEAIAAALSDRAEAAELTIFALQLRVDNHGWSGFASLGRRAKALARRAPEPLADRLVGAVDVLRARWHLETNRRATGVRFARRLCMLDDPWVRHAGYSALGLWAMRSEDVATAEMYLEESLCAPDASVGWHKPWFGLFTALRRTLTPDAPILREYWSYLERWHACHPYQPALARISEKEPDFPWHRALPEVIGHPAPGHRRR